MKKTLLFALGLIAVGCAEPIPRDLDELVEQGDLYANADGMFLDPETMTPYSGRVFNLDPQDSARVRFLANIEDGKIDGLSGYYFVNGSISKQTSKAGELHGPMGFYTKNGQLSSGGGTFNMGERCGEWIEGGETSSPAYGVSRPRANRCAHTDRRPMVPLD
jgi:hypothetical protein